MTNNVTVGAAGLTPDTGAPVYFEVGSTDAAQVYCGVVRDSSSHFTSLFLTRYSRRLLFCLQVGTSPAGHNPPNAALTVPGGLNSFAICNATGSESQSALQVLIFNAENNAGQGYDFSTCNPVTVELVDV